MVPYLFAGFTDEGQPGTLLFVVVNANGAPIEPDAAPTWRLYGANGLVASGTGSASSFETGTVTGATNTNPVTITTAAPHGLSVGQSVTIYGVTGNFGANGTYVVASVPSATTFTVAAAGNGNYAGGGTWRATGLYKVAMAGSVLSSLEAGKTYTVVLAWLEGGMRRGGQITFTVR